MKTVKIVYPKLRCFCTTTYKQSSSLPWISPLQFLKTPKQGPSISIGSSSVESGRKTKFISHESAIILIKRERDPLRALEIFNKIANQNGFNHNCATYSAILDKLGKFKKFQAIDGILHQMSYEMCKFHEEIFLNLMKHFSKSSLYEKVIEMFYAIQTIVREKPSLKAISTCLNLLVESKQVNLAREFLLYSVNTLHLEPNTCIFNILVKHHCKNGDLKPAIEVVAEMKRSKTYYPNLITYSTLIEGMCENGRLEEALNLFEKMVSEDEIVPDALTYNVLINGFCRNGKVDQAQKIMEFMKKNGCRPNVFNYSTLMKGYCKEGRLKEAAVTFDEMKSFNLKSDTFGYTILINGYCKCGRVDEAMKLLEEMKLNACKADVVTFNVLLGGLCREGRFKEAVQMLYQPTNGRLNYLNKASYRIVLNFLLKERQLQKAIELLGLMLSRGFIPHYATSNELLLRLCEAGKVGDAVTVLFGLVDMGFKPESSSWRFLVELICRERKLLPAFNLLDELVDGRLYVHRGEEHNNSCRRLNINFI